MSDPVAWFQRNWKWVMAGAMLFIVLVIVGLVFIFSWGMKSNYAYKHGLAIARKNAEVVAAIGEPMETGFFTGGSIQFENFEGTADLAIPVSGPKGEGTLYVSAEKSRGEWTMHVLEVAVDGRPERIRLLDDEGE